MKSCCKDVFDTTPVDKTQKKTGLVKWLQKMVVAIAGAKRQKAAA